MVAEKQVKHHHGNEADDQRGKLFAVVRATAPEKVYKMPTGSERKLRLDTRMLMRMNSFHSPCTVKMARVTMTGLDIGATMDQKMVQ